MILGGSEAILTIVGNRACNSSGYRPAFPCNTLESLLPRSFNTRQKGLTFQRSFAGRFMKLHSPPRRLLAIGVVLLALVFLANVMLGSVKIPPGDMLSLLFGNKPDSLFADIVWQFRLPKAITCVLAGSALAAGGLLMQTLFRNPPCRPGRTGIEFRGQLVRRGRHPRRHIRTGTCCYKPLEHCCRCRHGQRPCFPGRHGHRRRVRDNVSLLIIGLMIGAATSSIVSMLQFLSKADDLQAFMIWTLGSVGGTGWREIRVLTVVVLLGTGIAFRTMKSLNTLLLGENYARSLGVSLPASTILDRASDQCDDGSCDRLLRTYCFCWVGGAPPYADPVRHPRP